MLKIDDIKLDYFLLEDEKENLLKETAKRLSINLKDIGELKILRRSLDARHKPQLVYNYSLAVKTKNEGNILKNKKIKKVSQYEIPQYCYTPLNSKLRAVVVGAGPAGLFAAYSLCKRGVKPIILERGLPAYERARDVEAFWEKGILKPDSNVLFGEGGAGAFSDGKLNTLNKDIKGRCREVLRVLSEYSGDEAVQYDSKPHIGTDRLRETCVAIRKAIEEMGGEFHFNTKVTGFVLEENCIRAVKTEKEVFTVDLCVLAIGHSARDTFKELLEDGVHMEPKPFAVGFRVIHPQSLINESQYGMKNEHCLRAIEKGILPTASYKLTYKGKRGVYSFCMCPGGYVINSSSEVDGININGMSYHKRDSGYANSAIIVSVTPEDYPEGIFGGIEFQRNLEKITSNLAGGAIPIQYYRDFRASLVDGIHKDYDNTESGPKAFKGKTKFCDLTEILPKDLSLEFIAAMDYFGTIIKGFDNTCLMAAIEARTSCPVRIVRDGDGEASIKNLYPCGEGAGYAGGITSAAMDGLYIVECIESRNKK